LGYVDVETMMLADAILQNTKTGKRSELLAELFMMKKGGHMIYGTGNETNEEG